GPGCYYGPSKSVHRDHRVAVTPLAVDAQTRQRGRLLTPRMLSQHSGIPHLAVQDFQRAVEHDVVVGRIQKHEACGPDRFGRGFQPAHDVSADDVRALLEAESVQVLPQDSKTARLLINEGDPGRP